MIRCKLKLVFLIQFLNQQNQSILKWFYHTSFDITKIFALFELYFKFNHIKIKITPNISSYHNKLFIKITKFLFL